MRMTGLIRDNSPGRVRSTSMGQQALLAVVRVFEFGEAWRLARDGWTEPLSLTLGGKSCPIHCDLYVTYRSGKWSGRLDSNQRPPAPKAGALPGCATPRLELVSILARL